MKEYLRRRRLMSAVSCSLYLIRCNNAALSGDIGKEWIKSLAIESEIVPGQPYIPDSEMVDKFAVRTRVFDDFVNSCVLDDDIRQVCVIGAGLDTRPWRQFDADHVPAGMHWFEVDFPEIFTYKLRTISDAGGVPQCGIYHSVPADLSLSSWPAKLLAAGFRPDKKTAWIMEGLTGYLSEDELSVLVTTITDKLSAKGSRLMASFVGTACNVAKINLHRFQTDNGRDFMKKFGWEGTQDDLCDFLSKYGRGVKPNNGSANILNIKRGGLYICNLVR